MKKMSFCMMILCLATQNLSASFSPMLHDWRGFERALWYEKIESYRKEFWDEEKERLGYPETELAYSRELFKESGSSRAFLDEKIETLREDFKDAENLKTYLERFFREWDPCDDFPGEFKLNLGISDEVMRDALMGLIRESAAKDGWDDKTVKPGDPPGSSLIGYVIRNSIEWLRVCADAETKQFLLDIALDKTKAESYRREARKAYLHCADEQEKAAFLARLEAVRFQAKEGGAVSPSQPPAEAGRGVSHTPETDGQARPSPTFRAENDPAEKDATPRKLPLLIGTLIIIGGIMAWRCFKRRRT